MLFIRNCCFTFSSYSSSFNALTISNLEKCTVALICDILFKNICVIYSF